MFDLGREILQTLSHNKMRTALTGCAVAWGIFMLIVLLGMSRGVANSADSGFDSESMRSLSVWGGMTSQAHRGYKEGRRIDLRSSDIGKIGDEKILNVDQVQAMLSVDTAVVGTSRDYVSGGMSGVYPKYQKFENVKITHGRYITDRDIEKRRKVMVMESHNAALLFGSPDSAVGKRVESMSLSWTVVGVYKHEWARNNYVPYTTLEAVQADGDRVDNLRVMLSPEVSEETDAKDAEAGTRRALSKSHSFSEDDPGAVHIWNQFESYMRQNTAKLVLNSVVWIIGLLTLLSGIIGVSNIMFVSVKERTHEIGVRRAIGAKPRSILVQVVAESVAITALFGYIGIFFGILVTEAINQAFGDTDFLKNPTVDIHIALYVTVVLIIVGALAGIFPAIKATKVRPVEALRDE